MGANRFNESDRAVCRDALAILRQDVFPTLDELNDGEGVLARKCACFYDAAVAEVLAWPGWDFAAETVRVTASKRYDGKGWAAPAPEDAAAVRVVTDAAGRSIPWRIEDGYVLTDTPPDEVGYVRAERDVARWSPTARKALVYCLARDLAMAVTGRRADLQTASELYERMRRNARLADARDGNPGGGAYGPLKLHELVLGARGEGRHGRPW